MLKKSLIITSIFCFIIFLSNTVFGSNLMNDAKTGLENMGNGIKNVVQDVTNSVKDTKSDMTNTENNIENRADDDMTMGRTTNEGYTATRTDSTTTGYTTNNTMVWIILAIAGAIIVALVWYYAMQTQDRSNDHQ